jgi:hypothetical protein
MREAPLWEVVSLPFPCGWSVGGAVGNLGLDTLELCTSLNQYFLGVSHDGQDGGEVIFSISSRV